MASHDKTVLFAIQGMGYIKPGSTPIAVGK